MRLFWIVLLVVSVCAAESLGPDSDAYGAANDFPVGNSLNFFEQKYMVGSFSHFDSVFPSVTVAPAGRPWEFATGSLAPELGDRVKSYVEANPITGLLIAKDNQILFETYQYKRSSSDLFTSQSMAKSLVSMLAGIALPPQAISTPVSRYVPDLKNSVYGDVTVANLLHMSSGIDCQMNEMDSDQDSLTDLASKCRQTAPQGTRFHYSGEDSQVLGLIVSSVAHASLADYLRDRIWQRIGTQSKATWAVDKAHHETAHCCFNSTLRDYARFARLLANDGSWNGSQLIPKQWLIDATTVKDSDSFLSPGKSVPFYGYGYQLWIFPGPRRMFALLGSNGQRIFVDPATKLILVQTAVMQGNVNREKDAETIRLWLTLVHRQ